MLCHGQVVLQFGQFVVALQQGVGIGVDLLQLVIQLLDRALRREREESDVQLRERRDVHFEFDDLSWRWTADLCRHFVDVDLILLNFILQETLS